MDELGSRPAGPVVMNRAGVSYTAAAAFGGQPVAGHAVEVDAPEDHQPGAEDEHGRRHAGPAPIRARRCRLVTYTPRLRKATATMGRTILRVFSSW